MCCECSWDCMWPPGVTGCAKACMACIAGKVWCIMGPPKAWPLKHNLESEEGGPSGKCTKTGDVIIIKLDSEPEWALPWEDLWLHVLEYLSMQMQDQTLIMEWEMQAMEVIAQMAVSAISIMWEQWAA